MNVFTDVREFHEKFFPGSIPTSPRIPPSSVRQLWITLVEEETAELLKALREDDLVMVADGVADLIYVILGTAVHYGIPFPAIWEAVHGANMKKIGGGRRSDGKVLKPEDWSSPDIAAILSKYG